MNAAIKQCPCCALMFNSASPGLVPVVDAADRVWPWDCAIATLTMHAQERRAGHGCPACGGALGSVADECEPARMWCPDCARAVLAEVRPSPLDHAARQDPADAIIASQARRRARGLR